MNQPAERGGRRSRDGFSLIEVMVAMVILTVGVLGLAGTTGYFVRQITLADVMTERAVAFQTVVDRVQSMPYNNVTSGTDSVGVFAVSWNAVNAGSQNKIVTVVTVGPGLGGGGFPTNNPQAVDSFEFRILRR